MPFTCTEQKLRDHFKEIGDIEEVRIPRKPTGQLKGFAYIQFRDKYHVKQAVEKLDRSKIDGRTITVELSNSTKREQSIGYTVHVSNLSFKATEEDIKQVFEDLFGQIKMVHLVKEMVRGEEKSKGFGFVEFVE